MLECEIGQRDIGHWYFSSFLFVPLGTYNAFVDKGMGIQDALKLTGSDLKAFVFDKLLLAVREEQEAVGIKVEHVTCAHPLVMKSFARCSGIVQVSADKARISDCVKKILRNLPEYCWSTNQHLSVLAFVDIVEFVVYDSCLAGDIEHESLST